ncbi:MAG: hypothetical protein CVU94_09615 [Firmicutes bacterium HGW-Firmicutes-19]|jgi:hypothetical protein|nr:MAG: hypothetical protein CVU94_09615 [Firmicutes bacterium HGW-Firmicutes-19]
MFQIKKKFALPVGVVFFLLTFALFYIGVALILQNPLVLENYLAFAVFSLLVGIISACFVFFNLSIGFLIFTLGYVIGFGSMFYAFYEGMTGWGDLIGLIQMMFILGIGLATAVIVEIILLVIKKVKKA